MKYCLFLLLFVVTATHAQKLKKADKAIIGALQAHISYLADDKLEGRRTGTRGEQLALDYITGEFQKAGLTPKGSDNFVQVFEVNEGKQVNANSHLIINGNDLKLTTEYFPLVFSANGSVEAAPAVALRESGAPWFWNLKELLESNKTNPHFDLIQEIKTKVTEVKSKGATALLLYNTSAIDDELKFSAKEKAPALPIPVVYMTKTAAKKYLSDESVPLDIHLKVDIGEKIRTGRNAIGFIDNGAARTIVLGAHYDHLGMGEDGNSRDTHIEKGIHNGADDNASGTAALIELAKLLKGSKWKESNYAFIAFSGEELGLYGSKYFTDHPTIDFNTVNYMINMDMVGRLSDSSKGLTIGGFGTSPLWAQLINKEKEKYFNIRIDSSGTGPSDHTSFYRKDIPVLFFFTGLHSDYHMPSDDFDKINYVGELMVVKYIYNLIGETNKAGKLAFTKTREQTVSTNTRFKVTMGIMPDYTYSGEGVRADGVSEGKPAQKAGLQAGDIVIKIGDFATGSMDSYMQALGKFNKGEKVKIVFKRGNEVKETEVTF